MPKPLIDLPGLDAGRARNRLASNGLAPGVLRLAAADDKDEADLYIYGDIGGFWDGIAAEDVAREVRGLGEKTLNVRVNSGGGSVFDGVAIYNALAQHKGEVVVHVEGIAASIASVIAMAGDRILIGEAANIMIHKPWSFVIGDAEGMRLEADLLDKLEGGILDIYEARTGKPRDDLAAMVAAETWMRGKEAVDAGFADDVVPAKKREKAPKSALLLEYRNTPADLLTADDDSPKIREFERLLRDGEGQSNASAKRLASVAARFFSAEREAPQHRTTPRDEDGSTTDAALLKSLAAYIRSLI